MDLARLSDKFIPFDIEWRVQRSGKQGEKQWAMVLAYVTNRAIMERLDDVCGPENWKNEFERWGEGGVKCGISIRVPQEGEDQFGGKPYDWVTKYDGSEETKVETTKGGFSASMKRAGVQWGIGRYLYNLESTFVDIQPNKSVATGHTNYINDNKTGVKGYWKVPDMPKWALPKEETK